MVPVGDASGMGQCLRQWGGGVGGGGPLVGPACMIPWVMHIKVSRQHTRFEHEAVCKTSGRCQ